MAYGETTRKVGCNKPFPSEMGGCRPVFGPEIAGSGGDPCLPVSRIPHQEALDPAKTAEQPQLGFVELDDGLDLVGLSSD